LTSSTARLLMTGQARAMRRGSLRLKERTRGLEMTAQALKCVRSSVALARLPTSWVGGV
jgi:hypothetical protein